VHAITNAAKTGYISDATIADQIQVGWAGGGPQRGGTGGGGRQAGEEAPPAWGRRATSGGSAGGTAARPPPPPAHAHSPPQTMNDAYGRWGFRFVLANTTRVARDDWAKIPDSNNEPAAARAMKTALRKGTAADLNMYLVPDLGAHWGWG
jgi:hypothetical protein